MGRMVATFLFYYLVSKFQAYSVTRFENNAL